MNKKQNFKKSFGNKKVKKYYLKFDNKKPDFKKPDFKKKDFKKGFKNDNKKPNQKNNDDEYYALT